MVWGWLIGMWSAPLKRVVRSTNLIAAASTIVGALVFLFTNLENTIAFVLSAALTLVIHLVWRRLLARRMDSTLQGGNP